MVGEVVVDDDVLALGELLQPAAGAEETSSNGRQRCSTGYSRPETWITGAGPRAEAKCAAKRSASMVADVTTILRSGRRGSRAFR